MISENFDGPIIKLVGETLTDEQCQMKTGRCDVISGLAVARYCASDKLLPGEIYAGKLVCKGLREATQKDAEYLRSVGRPTDLVCDIEIQCSKE